MAIVIYNAQIDGRKAPISFDGVLLRPGSNDLDEGDVARLQAHSDMAGYVTRGAIEFEPAGVSSLSPGLLNLNTASLSDLVALPHIGRVTARRLIKARPLASMEHARVTSELSDDAWAVVSTLVEV